MLAQKNAEFERVRLENAQLAQSIVTMRTDVDGKTEKAKKKAKKLKSENSSLEKELVSLKTQNLLIEEQVHSIQVSSLFLPLITHFFIYPIFA